MIMDERITYILRYKAKSSIFCEQEQEAEERIRKRKKEICESENASIRDFHWDTKIVYGENDNIRVTISCLPFSEFETKTADELSEELCEAKKELEKLKEELEEIEDLDEDELEDYDFDSVKEYLERLEEQEDDIFLLEADIEVIETVLEEKSQDDFKKI